MVKKRKIQQKCEAESKGMLLAILKEWIVNPLENDFGFDFEVRLTSPIDDETQQVSKISFYIQNKSSINSEKEKAVEDLGIDDWILFLGQRIPVLITKYDVITKEFYWEIAQNYLWDTIEKQDKNWRRKKYKRITLTNKIKNLDKLKDAIILSQKRITRYHSLNLGIGEGIIINEKELDYLARIRKKNLDEYKFISLKEAYYARKSGNRQASIESLMNVYNSPNPDEAKVRAIIGIIFGLNVVDLKENPKIVAFANEAINLCEKLNINYLKDYVTILRNQAILYFITKKMVEIQLGLKIQEELKQQLFSYFYTQEFNKLFDVLQKVTREINDSLVSLISAKKIYYYIAALPILLDIFAIQTSYFAVFNMDILKEEKNFRKKFVEQCEYVLENISDIDLKKIMSRSLANYHYYILEIEKAIEFLTKAIELGKEDHDQLFVEANSELLNRIKKRPNPYKIPSRKKIDEMTTEEYQIMTEELLKAQGIKLEGDDDFTQTISLALRDLNPEEYFRHCENLHLTYLTTSALGASIGLPSLGMKFVWCKYCTNSIGGFDLKGAFNNFKKANCQSCVEHKPRNKNWICYVKWVKEQAESPEFKKVSENFKKM